MYARRATLHNYGPIERLDIEFPFSGDLPKPVVLVGENGSGKSILISHIVNGLLAAKSAAYPETPEIDPTKVYKFRSGLYITSGRDYYFARIDFEDDHFTSEIQGRTIKSNYTEMPPDLRGTAGEELWNAMKEEDTSIYSNSFSRDNPLDTGSISTKARSKFANSCILYFPPNRFEDPAWLNERHLTARAEHIDLDHMAGHTHRKVIASTPLIDNQNWLFDVLYDREVLEKRTQDIAVTFTENGNTHSRLLKEQLEYSGHATQAYEAALRTVRVTFAEPNARFGVGGRSDRRIAIMLGEDQVVPNIFQLSSGEVSLLNLFLSILRDFDMSDSQFVSMAGIRGIVVIDEIDLHLHVSHQYQVLPTLLSMFPKVQFVITTHSPLFVLGMENVFGNDGFALYRLPRGEQIGPEEFSEFAEAYKSFTETRRFSDDMRTVVENAQKPVAILEGTTDKAYLEKAAVLLGKAELLEGIELLDGKGKGNLDKVWKNLKPPLTDILNQKVMLLYDADANKTPDDRGRFLRRVVPAHPQHPIEKGIENLFDRDTLTRALDYRAEFVDIEYAHTKRVRGQMESVPETWIVNDDQKTNLCNWLCENGTAEDFQNFKVLFDVLEKLLVEESP